MLCQLDDLEKFCSTVKNNHHIVSNINKFVNYYASAFVQKIYNKTKKQKSESYQIKNTYQAPPYSSDHCAILKKKSPLQ